MYFDSHDKISKKREFKSPKVSSLMLFTRYLLGFLIVLAVATVQIGRTPEVIWANSGPAYWQGYLASEVLAVARNSPLVVDKEKLVFDLSQGTDFYTIQGKVTAIYEMVNPTANDLTVQMAFPFVSSLADFTPEDIVITVDGTDLSYELYLGDNLGTQGSRAGKDVSLAFADILSQISPQPYQAKNFSMNEKGRLYTFVVQPQVDRVNFVLDLQFHQDKTLVLAHGFHGYGRSGDHSRLYAWCGGAERPEIFVLGEDVDFQVTAYLEGEEWEATDLYTYEVITQEEELKPFLLSRLGQYSLKVGGLSSAEEGNVQFDDIQMYNIYARALDQGFNDYQGLFSIEDLRSQHYDQRIFTLVYEVDFPAHGARTVTVSYKATATMDKTKTVKPIYSFHYLLNPARNWKSFGNLDIEIFTPEAAPYILESSVDFTPMGENYYRATLKGLPQQDLTFSLYHKEEITFGDQVPNSVKRALWVLIICIIAIVAVIGLFHERSR